MRDRDVATGAAKTLDLTQPVALVISDVLGHIVDWDDALSLVRRLVERLPSGSYLSLSHSTASDEAHRAVQDEYNASGAIPYIFREPETTIAFFDGLEMVEPGMVSWPNWRPDANTGTTTAGPAGARSPAFPDPRPDPTSDCRVAYGTPPYAARTARRGSRP
ncbi:hypothetical protein SBADM41S_08601 [Streptomyces badius]